MLNGRDGGTLDVLVVLEQGGGPSTRSDPRAAPTEAPPAFEHVALYRYAYD